MYVNPFMERKTEMVEVPKKRGRPRKAPAKKSSSTLKLSDIGKVKNAKAQVRVLTAYIPAGKRKPLKPREAKFVEIWASADGKITAKEAAIQSGFPEKSAHNVGHLMTHPEKSPHVVEAIRRRQAELHMKYGTTFERHMKDLLLLRDKAIEAGAWAAAIQAEYRRGQALGSIYIDRKEIRHGTIDSMSKEEVQRKLESLRKMYQASPNVVDVEEAKIIDSIEMEREADKSEEFLDEAGEQAISEDEDGDDEIPDNSAGVVGQFGRP
jgi:phage terminase small subunit